MDFLSKEKKKKCCGWESHAFVRSPSGKNIKVNILASEIKNVDIHN